MAFEALRSAIDELSQGDAAVLADPESIVELEFLASRLEAVLCVSADAFAESGAWSADGAQSAVAWLTKRTRAPRAALRRQVLLGRSLRQVPKVKESWLCGGIGGPQAEAICRVIRPVTKEAYERDEEFLLNEAGQLDFAQFSRFLSYWESHANPDGSEQKAQDQRDRRDAYLEASFEGMWLGRLTLDPVSGAIVSEQLRSIEDELFFDDWSKAKEALGHDPKVEDLERTPNQRRADALVEMAVRAGSVPEGARRPAPLFSVLVGYEQLCGPILELAQGQPLTPGSLLPWLEEADLERAVFSPEGRVECSVHARLFTGATRRAIELRDQQCQHAYCEKRAKDCQVDHIVPFVAGGATRQDNGQLLCGFHNRLKTQRPPPGEPF